MTMRRYIPWIGALVILIAFVGLVYGVAQQIERQGADDAPLRLASQVADEVTAGSSSTVDALPRVDLSKSLAPFVVVFGADGTPIAGNGYDHGTLASPPAGVIADARAHGEDQVSWQTASGLRFATVSLKAGDQVVMAAQSLAPSETRTGQLGRLILLGGAASLVVFAAAFIAWESYERWAPTRR